MSKSWKSISMLIFSFVSFMVLGSVYSWSVVKTPLEKALNLTSFQSNLPFMIFLMLYAIFMPLGGVFQKIMGIRRTFLLGALLVSLGYFLAGQFKAFYTLVFWYGIVVGSGVGLCYNVPLTIIARYFPKSQGTLSGFVLAGFGISPLISAPLYTTLIKMVGVFNALKLYSLIAFGVLFTTYLIYGASLESFKIDTKNAQKQKTSKSVAKNSEFQAVYLLFFFATLIGLMFIGISSQIGLEIVGLSMESISVFISIFAVFNAFGRLLVGFILDKVDEIIVVSGSYILLLISLLLGLFLDKQQVVIYFSSLSLIWFNFGSWLAIAPYLTRKYFGVERFAQNYGLMFTAYGLGAIFGNTLSGLVKDKLGNYKLIFYPSIFLIITGIVIIFTIFKAKFSDPSTELSTVDEE
ncbi:MAG: MFS transporter [Fervidobacterium sp.]|nr:MFS transporter [Fervidobacterium sp.]